MADPIEDFLRRVIQQRRRPSTDDDVIDAEILADDIEIVEVESSESNVTDGESVAEHVQHHIGSADFSQRVARLGRAVDVADDQMEAHLHQVFEHKLGQLGVRTSVAADSILDDDSDPAKEPPAELDVRKLFETPENIRNAILLNEIIRRPEHLW